MSARTLSVSVLLSSAFLLAGCGGSPTGSSELPPTDASDGTHDEVNTGNLTGDDEGATSSDEGPLGGAPPADLKGPQTEPYKVSDWGPVDPCAKHPNQCKGAPDPVLFAQCEVVVGNASFRGDGDGDCGEHFAVGAIRAAMCDAGVKPTADDYKRAKCTLTIDPCKAAEREACKSSSGPPLKCSLAKSGGSIEKTGQNCGKLAPQANGSIMKELCDTGRGITSAQFRAIKCVPDEGQVK